MRWNAEPYSSAGVALIQGFGERFAAALAAQCRSWTAGLYISVLSVRAGRSRRDDAHRTTARLSSRLLDRGWIAARIVVPGGALLLAAVFTAPAVWTHNPILGIALLTMGTAALAAANPPIDAARLDVMHPRLWGRAESVRMALRGTLEAVAPLVFGWLSVQLGPGDAGLQWTFLIMLVAVVAAGLLAIPARRVYARDVATADASVEAVPAQ